jgi:hypothetical protein
LENKNFLADFKPEKVLKRVAEACLVIFTDLKNEYRDLKEGTTENPEENFLSGLSAQIEKISPPSSSK